MTRAPLVTVAIPARNAASTLPCAISSIRAQTLQEWELVLIDHSSHDSTPSVMRRASRDDARITWSSCTGTFVEAANLAWRRGVAPLVARMDADDLAHPERLALQVDFLEKQPALSGCASLVRIRKRDPSGGPSLPPGEGYARYEEWINSVTSPEQITAQRFVDSPLPNPATMVRRQVLEECGGYHDPDWAEDYDLWLRLLQRGHRFGKVPRVLLDWHDDASRATRTIERYALPRFQQAKAHYLARLPHVRAEGVALAGAGPIGKEMAGLLRREGIEIRAFLEVDPRKIGNRLSGVPVLDSTATPSLAGNTVLLGSVGRPGARDRIRSLAIASGFREGTYFFCVA